MENVREILEGQKMQVIEQLNEDLAQAHQLIQQLLNIVYYQNLREREVIHER